MKGEHKTQQYYIRDHVAMTNGTLYLVDRPQIGITTLHIYICDN